MSRGVCENLSHGGVLFPITKCKYGSNFNFTCIKIRNLLVTQLTEEEEKKKKKKKKLAFRIRKADRAGLLRGVGRGFPLGLVGKRFHPRGWLQRRKCSLSPLSPRFGGKPGENQSAKLEYKPISGGVGNVRCSREEKDRRNERQEEGEKERSQTETTDRFRRKPRFRRDSNLHTLHKIA